MTPRSPRYRMFIDDTGNVHSRTSNHPQSRFAGVVGIIFELDYLHTTFEPSFDKLKAKHFGLRDDGQTHVLHLRKMKKAEGPFGDLRDQEFRETWQRDCLRMYTLAAYTVIAVCVDKVAFYAAHPSWQGSIYQLLVGNAIERYFYYLRLRRGTGDVLTEATNSDLDQEIKKLYRQFYSIGTDHIPGATLRTRLTSNEIKIKPKTDNLAGLQLADMLAATCFSHCRKIYAEGPDYDSFAMEVADLIEGHKFYRDSKGDPHRYGRIWRP